MTSLGDEERGSQDSSPAWLEEGDIEGSQSFSVGFTGPLPPPGILRGYDDIVPGSAERLLKMAEAEQKRRHQSERFDEAEARKYADHDRGMDKRIARYEAISHKRAFEYASWRLGAELLVIAVTLWVAWDLAAKGVKDWGQIILLAAMLGGGGWAVRKLFNQFYGPEGKAASEAVAEKEKNPGR